jgi:predicted GNAT family acetyltransferase
MATTEGMTAENAVVHNESAARFEMRTHGHLCIAQYRLIDGVMWLTHTEVPPALRGRGHAARVVQAALDHARAHGLKVRPACSYVHSYMRRHPEARDLMETH